MKKKRQARIKGVYIYRGNLTAIKCDGKAIRFFPNYIYRNLPECKKIKDLINRRLLTEVK